MVQKILAYICVGAFCINLCLFGLACMLESFELQLLSLGSMFLLSFALLRTPKSFKE
jgi:hypothetical protein